MTKIITKCHATLIVTMPECEVSQRLVNLFTNRLMHHCELVNNLWSAYCSGSVNTTNEFQFMNNNHWLILNVKLFFWHVAGPNTDTNFYTH